MMQCPMLETLRSGKSAHVVHEYTREKYSTFYGNIVTYPLTNEDGDIFQSYRNYQRYYGSHLQRPGKNVSRN